MRKGLIFGIVLLFSVIFTDSTQASYDYTTGRWLTQDPIGYQDGLNLYEYVRSNPIIKIDYLGFESSCCSKKNCQWSGVISASAWGIMFGNAKLKIYATGVDDTGCSYAVKGTASHGVYESDYEGSGGIFGYATVSVEFETKDECQWPIKIGQSISCTCMGVGGSVWIPISLTICQCDTGYLWGWGFNAQGGFNIVLGGFGISGKLEEVITTGPSEPPKKS